MFIKEAFEAFYCWGKYDFDEVYAKLCRDAGMKESKVIASVLSSFDWLINRLA